MEGIWPLLLLLLGARVEPSLAWASPSRPHLAPLHLSPLRPLSPLPPPIILCHPPANATHEKRAHALLNSLDGWLRVQPVSSVLSRTQAGELLQELRSDRRFWAQQRRQYARVWDALVEGLSQEQRPLAVVLGPGTCERLLSAFEEMDDEPAIVKTVLQSEIVEKMIGHVLYEGILEFIQRADLFGNIINGLPIIGALRVQMISAARDRLTLVLGDQLIKFLGEYSTSAAEGAVEFALSDENKPYFRKARRRLGKRLLETPISKLVALNQLEMAILRDSIWAAVREFRLPNEESLLDALYEEFGEEPFGILLPTQTQAEGGDAAFYEAARGVLHGTLSQFLASEDWRDWSVSNPPPTENDSAAALEESEHSDTDETLDPERSEGPRAEAQHNSESQPAEEGSAVDDDTSAIAHWDGWD